MEFTGVRRPDRVRSVLVHAPALHQQPDVRFERWLSVTPRTPPLESSEPVHDRASDQTEVFGDRSAKPPGARTGQRHAARPVSDDSPDRFRHTARCTPVDSADDRRAGSHDHHAVLPETVIRSELRDPRPSGVWPRRVDSDRPRRRRDSGRRQDPCVDGELRADLARKSASGRSSRWLPPGRPTPVERWYRRSCRGMENPTTRGGRDDRRTPHARRRQSATPKPLQLAEGSQRRSSGHRIGPSSCACTQTRTGDQPSLDAMAVG